MRSAKNIFAVLFATILTDACVQSFFFARDGGPLQWNSIKVKWAVFFGGHYSIPLTTAEIMKSGEFEFFDNHKDYPKIRIYCYPEDPRVCPIYDMYGRIAGLRTTFIKKDIENRVPEGETFPYTYEKKPVFKRGVMFGQDCYYIDTFFVNPDLLKQGGPETRTEAVGDGVYFNIDGKNWINIPRKESEIGSTPYTKQACYPGMGMHYFYKVTKDMDCNDYQPPFVFYDHGELVGFGIAPFGTFTSTTRRTWFEDPPGWIIKKIFSNGASCLWEWIEKYGGISLHVFFKPCPRTACIL